MTVNKCLYCYKTLHENEKYYHSKCLRKFYGTKKTPTLDYTKEEMNKLANDTIRSQISVTGVQPKLSLDLEKGDSNNEPQRFTIVGLWGSYILKPPFDEYPNLPELEDLTMHLAEEASIQTVPHSLIPLKNGDLAYITKRIDRVKNQKFPMEDMCQLTERLTEHKYLGSYEQIGKAILKFSANPILDLTNFFEVLIFSFITGNADMHLKNFSVINNSPLGYVLSPAYDLVPTALVMPNDTEETALNLNGKKRKLKWSDFQAAMSTLGINSKVQYSILERLINKRESWLQLINTSFITDHYKEDYSTLLKERISRFS